MQIDLQGSVVLVTGASRGIGQALAQGLAEAGATVAVHYNRHAEAAEALVETLGQGAQAFQANLEDPAATSALFEAVVAHYGQLNVLVNNAGLALKMPLELSVPAWQAAWDTTMAVNLRATALLCRLAIPHFQAQGEGRIINVASRAAFRGDTADYIAYAASKGGMVALTRSIARAYGKDRICAFLLAPGFVRTDMAQDFIDTYGESYLVDDLALPELTEPRHLAPLVTLLASGLADHATGTSIDINAGSYVH